jgi:hypothetical protein
MQNADSTACARVCDSIDAGKDRQIQSQKSKAKDSESSHSWVTFLGKIQPTKDLL